MPFFSEVPPERAAELRAETEEKLAADREADEDRAEVLRWIERTHREKEEQPHYEVRANCAGCGCELIIEVPVAYCDDCA